LRYIPPVRDREAGFTLLELMVTVVVVAILAAIALPSFFSETRKAKASSEVQPMFNDIRIRLEQYLQENGRYPPSPAGGETALRPAGEPSTTKAALGTPAGWDKLKLRTSGNDAVSCRYAWVTGTRDTPIPVGTQAEAFGFTDATKPESDWYYLLAKCDMDNSGAAGNGFSWYFASSADPKLLTINDGG
jgi:prepilin-type N-terminal cleavage/methylation domain-containing protein